MSHSSQAQIHPSAQIAADVEIGPWTVIGPNVVIGAGCKIGSHVVIQENTTMGENNIVHSFALIGGDSQHKGEPEKDTTLEIGDHNVIHGYVTINRGSHVGTKVTKIGNHCLFMMASHVAHDCELADHIILANHATLGGHVTIGDYAILGAFTAVHQFCHVGAHAFLTRACLASKDIMPYVNVSGNQPSVAGLNKTGLKRRGFTAEMLSAIDEAYRIVFRQSLTKPDALKKLEPLVAKHEDIIGPMYELLKNSTRGIER